MKKIYAWLIKILGLSLLALLPVAVQASSNNFTYYVNDAVGSPVVAMNQAGDVIWRKTYQPYGKASGKDGDNRIGYTGHVEDKPDLVYAGARYYDPDLMRFLSDDSVRFTEKNPMSFNRYAYANNNPYKFVDPDGRDPLIGATVGCVAGVVYGALGARMAGGSWGETVVSAAVGGAFGLAVGFVDPSLGVGTLATIGAISAGGADLAGQVIVNSGKADKPLVNPGSVAGAVVGGALGGAGAAAFAPIAAGAGMVSETVGTSAVTAITSGPGVFTTAIGNQLGEAAMNDKKTNK